MELQQKSSAVIKPLQTQNEESRHVSTWAHRAWFGGGCATMLFSIAKSLILTGRGSRPWLESMLAAMAAYLVADLGAGIYHWAIDNYGSAQTPIFGSQIEGFQGHHQQPWLITKTQLANKLHITAAAVTVAAIPINVLCNEPVLLLFVGVFSACIIFSQQFHAWAHTPKGKLPPLVVALQDAGIILRQAEHAAHHRPPFNSNYCIVSGIWNRALDKSKFFLALEVVVVKVLGHRPRSWNDPSSGWTEISGVN
nr:fatty acid desaturase 4.1 [Perilla frutescens]